VRFNSLTFLIFFWLSTSAYFALPYRRRWALLLICSALFYAAYIPAYLLVLAVVIVIDYVAGLAIERATGNARKLWLLASVLANIGLLAAFKYFDFASDNLHTLLARLQLNYPVRHIGLLLPIGLSFHTFQSLSYTIEVYRGRQRAERHPGMYALYVMFYPQLVAGPIERPQNLLHQFREDHVFDADRIFAGLRQMLWGFFKKLVIADRLANIVDPIYRDPRAWGRAYLWLATYCFAFQIYCDFSGYSDIALGAARVLGIKLMTNFDRPYAARSVAEFWRRWHISLSTWFRDYVYFPLRGNRVTVPRWCVNVLIVFLISGLWHGASWTFVVWGAIHGMYLIIGRLTGAARARLSAAIHLDRLPVVSAAVKIFLTFNLIAITWVFFRAASLAQASFILAKMARGPLWDAPPFTLANPAPFVADDLLLIATLVVLMELIQWISSRPWNGFFDRQPAWVRWPAYYAVIIAILWFGALGGRTFIYFQF
jgi:D-alanyl-lipoteichoic acid acyltransferase DltB (MBOAT superfamily)